MPLFTSPLDTGWPCRVTAKYITLRIIIATVLDFWEFYGADTIRSYIYDMVTSAGKKYRQNT